MRIGLRASISAELLLDDVADVLERRRLAPHLLRELVAQLLEVDLAQVERQPFGLVLARRLRRGWLH